MRTLVMRRIAGMATMAVLAAVFALGAIPAFADHEDTYPSTAEANQAAFWEDYGATEEGEADWSCVKNDDGGGSYTLGSPPAGQVWRLLVVKAGSDYNNLYWNPTPGNSYTATGQGAGSWSHVILCSRPIPTDTSTTETSVTDSSVTDTSVTDTSITDTSITDTSITDTSITDTSITDTSTPDTPNLDPPEPEETTTTIGIEVSPTTTTPTVSESTLPFTGLDSDSLAMVAVLALATGIGLVLLARRSAEVRGRHRAF